MELCAVHAYGKVTIRDDERYVRVIVAGLTRTHEASQPEPWKVSDTPKECIDGLLKAIVGIEIEITKIEGQAKRSRAAIERLGAKLDEVLRSHQIVADDILRDTYVYSILKNEWPAVQWLLQKPY